MTSDVQRAERLGRLVPIAIGLSLAAMVVLNVVVYRVASDGGVNIEPDYYRQALNWDSTLVQEQASVALGWRADASLHRTSHGTQLRVTLRDSHGREISDAALVARVRHNSDALHTTTVALVRDGNAYVGDAGALRPGLHEVALVATRGAQRFRTTLRRDVGDDASVIAP
jgi:nitrogen fixation protein FixH